MAIDPTTLFPGAAGDREGAIIHIRPENLWQDAAGTMAVTTDGDPVRRIDDISVNSRDFVIFSTNPMTYHTDGTVHWLTFGGTESGFVAEDSWSFLGGGPYTSCAAVAFDDPTNDHQYFFGTDTASGGNNDNSKVHNGLRSSTTVTIAHFANDQNYSYSTPTATPERHICEYLDPGSEYTVDGTSIGSSGTTPSDLDQIEEAYIGVWVFGFGGLACLDGDIYGMIILADTITSQEKADIDEWLQEQIDGPSEQTVEVGQASETSSANAVGHSRVASIGQASETDAANAVTAVTAIVVNVGQAAETSAANAVEASKLAHIGQAEETDTAGAVVAVRIRGVGQASETASASAVVLTRAWAVGQATETASAGAVTLFRTAQVGLASETSSAGEMVILTFPQSLFPGAADDRVGAILYIRPENLWQDEAGTIQADTQGDPVRRVDDISVNGRHFVVFDTNEPLTYNTDGTVHWLSSAGNTSQGLISSDTWSSMNDSPYSLGVAVAFDTPAAGSQYFVGTQPLVGGSNFDSEEIMLSVVHWGARNGTQVTVDHWFSGVNYTYSTPTTPERHIGEYFNPGNEYTIDGTQIGTSVDTPTTLDNVGHLTLMIIDLGDGTYQEEFPMPGDLYGAILIVDTISSSEKTAIDAWLQEQIEGPSEQTIPVGTALETSTANAVGRNRTLATGQASETSAALALATVVPVGQADETSTANVVTFTRSVLTGQASETSAANAVTARRTELVTQALEEDTANAVAALRTHVVGQASETSSANVVAFTRAKVVGQATETATANAVDHSKVKSVGQATSTEAAATVNAVRAFLVGQSTETSAANSVDHSRVAILGVATESDDATVVEPVGGFVPEPEPADFWVLRRRRRWA